MALTAEQVAAALAPNSGWPYAGAEDGWVKAHDALRADMCDLSAALRLLANAGSYNAWQVCTCVRLWQSYHCRIVGGSARVKLVEHSRVLT